MKTIFSSCLASMLLFISCSNNQNSGQMTPVGTHQHADGSTHENHEHDEKLNQQEFSVSQDTLAVKGDSTRKQNHEVHDHPHKH